MTQEKLNEVLKQHKLWLEDSSEGIRANLRGANLEDANLRGADLRGADLKVYQSGKYTAYIQKERTRIGCKYYSNEEWKKFTDDQINNMDAGALDYWNNNKAVIFSIMDSLK